MASSSLASFTRASASSSVAAAAQIGMRRDLAERFRRESPRLLRRGHDHLRRPREQDAADLLHGFIAHRAVDQPHPALSHRSGRDTPPARARPAGLCAPSRMISGCSETRSRRPGHCARDACLNGVDRQRPRASAQPPPCAHSPPDARRPADRRCADRVRPRAGTGCRAHRARDLRCATRPAARTGIASSAARAFEHARRLRRCRANTAGTPGFRMPAFSPAIDSRLLPRKAS